MTTHSEPLTYELRDDASFVTIYRGDRPVGTLQRRRVYSRDPYAWRIYAASGGEIGAARYSRAIPRILAKLESEGAL